MNLLVSCGRYICILVFFPSRPWKDHNDTSFFISVFKKEDSKFNIYIINFHVWTLKFVFFIACNIFSHLFALWWWTTMMLWEINSFLFTITFMLSSCCELLVLRQLRKENCKNKYTEKSFLVNCISGCTRNNLIEN